VMGGVQPASQRQSSFQHSRKARSRENRPPEIAWVNGGRPRTCCATPCRKPGSEVCKTDSPVEEGIRAPGLSAPGLPALKATWTPFRAIEWSLGSRSRFSPPSARLGLPPPPFTRSSPFGASLKIGESNDRRLSSDGSARASAIRLRGEEGRTLLAPGRRRHRRPTKGSSAALAGGNADTEMSAAETATQG
jgi:hypothetical protein